MKTSTQDILRQVCPAIYADIFTIIDDVNVGTKKYWKEQFNKCFEDIQEEYYYQDTLQYRQNNHEKKQLCLNQMMLKLSIARGDNSYFDLPICKGITTTSGRKNYD